MAENTTPETRACAAAVVVAAGSGRRMGSGNKALLDLAGEPVLARSLRALQATPAVAQIVVVMGAEDREAFRSQWGSKLSDYGADLVVDGGQERWQSSLLGLQAADATLRLLLVHDAARPMVSAEDFQNVLEAADRQGSALLAEPLNDTLKEVDAEGRVLRTMPREQLWRAATPQAARRELLLSAFEAWPADAPPPTDECQLLEAAGHAPQVVEAQGLPLKITRAADHILLEKLLLANRND